MIATEVETYTNPETSKSWGSTASGALWCEDCDGTLMVTVPGHGLLEDYDCESPHPHSHTCETCET